MRDPEFLSLCNILDAYILSKATSKWCWLSCQDNRVDHTARGDEEKLWQAVVVLNPDNPKGLLNCVFFLNGRNFCLRGGVEH